MVQGSTLGGTDTVNGGGGTDEITFENLDNIAFLYHADATPNPTGQYANFANDISGDVTFVSIEQIYADDGVESAVRLAFSPGDTGYGYIVAGKNTAETINLSNGQNLSNWNLSHTISTGNVLGSIVFGKAGNDTITGSEGGDILFGGDGADIIDGGGSTNGDEIYGGDGGDALTGGAAGDEIYGGNHNDTINGGGGQDDLFGGDGDDTFNVVASDMTSGDSFTGNTGTDKILTTEATLDISSNSIGITSIEALESTNGSANTFVVRNDMLTGSNGSIDTIDAGAAGSTLRSSSNALDATGLALTNITTLETADTSNPAAFIVDAALLSPITTINSGGAGGAISTGEQNLDLTGITTSNVSSAQSTNAAAATITVDTTNLSSFNAFTSATAGGTLKLADGNTVANLTSVTLNNISNVTGGTGNDSITIGGSSPITVQGGQGGDSLSLNGTGTQTVVFDSYSSNGKDNVFSFNAGASGDILDVDGLGLNGAGGSNATTSLEIISSDAAVSAGTNTVVLTYASFQDFSSSTTFATQVADFLTAISGTTFEGSFEASDQIAFLVNDTSVDSNVSLWHWADDGDGIMEAADTWTDIATVDSTTITDLHADNFI